MLSASQALAVLVLLLGVGYLIAPSKLDDDDVGEDSAYLRTQPIHGIRKEWFAWARARLRSLSETSRVALEGYEKYSRMNIPFTIPTLDHGPTVVIPRQQIKKVYGLPENVLDVKNVQDESMQLHWTFPDPHIQGEPLHMFVVRNQLTQNIPKLTARVAAEIEYGFDRGWGRDTEWRDVRIWNSSLRIIAGAANGAFCGLPLCRDTVFLDRLKDHAMAIFGGAIAVGCLPLPLQYVFGPLLLVVCRVMAERVMWRSRPVIKQRLENTAKLRADPTFDWTPPEDALQWVIDECYASPNREEQLSLRRVCERLLLTNDISLLTTAYTAQNFILDLFSTDPKLGYVEALREECARVREEAGGRWTADAIKKLQLVDSAIRESMRLSPFGSVLLPRKVVDPKGINVDGWSARIPKGTRIALPVESIHYDEQTYRDAHHFNPFRFMQPTEETDPVTGAPTYRAKSTVTLDESFLSFGVPGRNACPGRFFALLELKIFVADLLLNYDVQFLESRPPPVHMMWVKYPSDATIRIRRRETKS